MRHFFTGIRFKMIVKLLIISIFKQFISIATLSSPKHAQLKLLTFLGVFKFVP